MPYRDVNERSKDYGEVLAKLPPAEHADLLSTQSARCMDCGTPFCHQTGTGAPCSQSFTPFPAIWADQMSDCHSQSQHLASCPNIHKETWRHNRSFS